MMYIRTYTHKVDRILGTTLKEEVTSFDGTVKSAKTARLFEAMKLEFSYGVVLEEKKESNDMFGLYPILKCWIDNGQTYITDIKMKVK